MKGFEGNTKNPFFNVGHMGVEYPHFFGISFFDFGVSLYGDELHDSFTVLHCKGLKSMVNNKSDP